MKNFSQHKEAETRLQLDELTKILRVNGVWIEDLDFCERLKIHTLLFRGCKERAQVERECDELFVELEDIKAQLESKRLDFQLLLTIFFFLSVALILGGVIIW